MDKFLKNAMRIIWKHTVMVNVSIAYRSLARENGKGNKCNIDLAKDAFEHIRRVGDVAEQVVIIADIKSFFDTLNHKLLKIAWKRGL